MSTVAPEYTGTVAPEGMMALALGCIVVAAVGYADPGCTVDVV